MLPEGLEQHFFLSHYQATAGDQVDGLHMELSRRGFSCWYDNRMTNLTKQGNVQTPPCNVVTSS